MFTQRTTCYRSSINSETPSAWGSLTDVSKRAYVLGFSTREIMKMSAHGLAAV